MKLFLLYIVANLDYFVDLNQDDVNKSPNLLTISMIGIMGVP